MAPQPGNKPKPAEDPSHAVTQPSHELPAHEELIPAELSPSTPVPDLQAPDQVTAEEEVME